MTSLIDAFWSFLADAAGAGGELGRTAGMAIDGVDWTGAPQRPQPQSHPAVAGHLETAIEQSGAPGTSSRALAEAVRANADRIAWRAPADAATSRAERAAFSRRHTACRIIGERGFLPSRTVIAGLTMQAPDTYYPPHAHAAEESYWVIGGGGEWKVGSAAWFTVGPGDGIHHPSEVHHTMATGTLPMLTVWLWTSDLESEVRIVGPWRR